MAIAISCKHRIITRVRHNVEYPSIIKKPTWLRWLKKLIEDR
jgi:hypothetical protein